jgi:large subunit ribosomal protein L14e
MALFDIGRVCVKLAGRDAGKKCVIVDIKDEHVVLLDGETRRRHCNVKHLEPLNETLDLKKGASHVEVVAAFKRLGLEARETKTKKPTPRPKHIHTTKVPTEASAEKKSKKAPLKKETKPEQKE